ncbi:MAG: hypothetical protein ACREIW_13740 [Chthoniobacterales bacterium]
MPRRKLVFLAWFFLHFFFIAAISCRDIFWLIANRLTLLPPVSVGIARKFEPIASAAIGQNMASSNRIRRVLFTYFHLAGIDRGYGYFAPNIPGNYKLVFELHYPDERVDYALPKLNSKAAGLRLTSLLDEIGHAESDRLREYLIRGITRAIWREHPDAASIRAIFGRSRLPSVNEFEQGKRESYEFLCAYDFSRDKNPADSKNP